jgi:hypothetical protein
MIESPVNHESGQNPPDMMRHEDFKIGVDFTMSGNRWRCVDKGTWSIEAIRLDRPDDPSWYIGPPYAVVVSVLDSTDFPACTEDP